MKVKETYNDFTNYIFSGFNAYHIVCDKNGGTNMEIDELLSLSKHYYRIFFLGDTNPFLDDIVTFAKKLAKINENVLVQVYTDGTVFNSYLSKCDNVIFIVAPELEGEKPFAERINYVALKKYAKSEAFFIFNASDIDGSDKTSLIMSEAEISAYAVFIIGNVEYAKTIGANVIC
jgi:hypothetical protein